MEYADSGARSYTHPDSEPEPSYCWAITKDKIEDGKHVGTEGPHDAPDSIPDDWQTRKFRMLDDDGNVYYYGIVAAADIESEEAAFGPLDDFGAPNAGCTMIQWRTEDGEWETI